MGYVFIGGGIGCLFRYLLAFYLPFDGNQFPIATFLANMFACLIIGIAWSYFSIQTDERMKLLIITGFCGGFSTFSTFSIEAIRLVENHHLIKSIFYVLITNIVCLIMVFIGLWLGKSLGES